MIGPEPRHWRLSRNCQGPARQHCGSSGCGFKSHRPPSFLSLNRGSKRPFAIVVAWVRGAFELIISDRLIGELREVLLRPKFRRYKTEVAAVEFVEQLKAATLLPDPPAVRLVPLDAKDDYLMALLSQHEPTSWCPAIRT